MGRTASCSSPGAQHGHSCSSSLADPGVLTRRVTEAAWEMMGCLPAGRVLEIDPPTSKVICSHCSTTEKQGRIRNKRIGKKSTGESKTWKSNKDASEKKISLVEAILLPGLTVSGEERIEALGAEHPGSMSHLSHLPCLWAKAVTFEKD